MIHFNSSFVVVVSAGLPVNLQMGATLSDIQQDMSGLDSSLDYEIPENIRKLHQLALQYVSQVSRFGRVWGSSKWIIMVSY